MNIEVKLKNPYQFKTKGENNMAKFINVIKYKIKDGSKDECLKKINEMYEEFKK